MFSKTNQTTRDELASYESSLIEMSYARIPFRGIAVAHRNDLELSSLYVPNNFYKRRVNSMTYRNCELLTIRSLNMLNGSDDGPKAWHLPIRVLDNEYCMTMSQFPPFDSFEVEYDGERGKVKTRIHAMYVSHNTTFSTKYCQLRDCLHYCSFELMDHIFTEYMKYFCNLKDLVCPISDYRPLARRAFAACPMVELLVTMYPNVKRWNVYMPYEILNPTGFERMVKEHKLIRGYGYIRMLLLKSPLYPNTWVKDWKVKANIINEALIYVYLSHDNPHGFPTMRYTNLDRYCYMSLPTLLSPCTPFSEDLPNFPLKYVNSLIQQICRHIVGRPVANHSHVDAWSRVQILKIIYQYGWCRNYSYARNHSVRLRLCPRCYNSEHLSDINHCVSDHHIDKYLLPWKILFTGIYYWLEKMLPGVYVDFNIVKHNVLYVFDTNGARMYDPYEMIELVPEEATMFSIFKKTEVVAENVSAVTEEITDSGVVTQTANLVSRVNEILDRNHTRIDQIITSVAVARPILDDGFNIDSMLETFNNTIRLAIKKFYAMIVPGQNIDEHLESIRFTTILKNFYLMYHVKNKVAIALLIAEVLNCFNAGVQFTRFFECVRAYYSSEPPSAPPPTPAEGVVNEEPVPSTSGCFSLDFGTIGDWFASILIGTKDIFNYLAGVIAGFVGNLVPGNDWMNSLRTYLRSIGHLGRDFHGFTLGVGGICKVFDFIKTCWYTAKDFVFKKLGIPISLPIEYDLKNRITSFLTTADIILAPSHRASLISTVNMDKVLGDIFKAGRELQVTACCNPTTRALAGIMTPVLTKLAVLYADSKWAADSAFESYVPFVVHLDGPVNCGKSTLLSLVKKSLCKALGISDRAYAFNETLGFMDGYQYQEVLTCDDMNLNKTGISVAWLIKIVGPNLPTLPTAENEHRPLTSNIKLILLTSNTPYSPVVDLATTDGIDRRSTWKISVTPDPEVYQNSKLDIAKCKEKAWDIWKFERISSVRGDNVEPADAFKGRIGGLLNRLYYSAIEHDKSEKARLFSNGSYQRSQINRVAIMDEIYKAHGMTNNESQVVWDHRLIDDHVRVFVPQVDVATMDDNDDHRKFEAYVAELMAEMNAEVPNFELYKDGLIRYCTDRGIPIPTCFDGGPIVNWYPVYDNGCLKFTSEPHDFTTDVNLVVHDPIRPYTALAGGNSYTFCLLFLNGLEWRETEFVHSSMQPIDMYADDAGNYKPGVVIPAYTYQNSTILTTSSSFLHSARTFFSLPLPFRVHIFCGFQTYKRRMAQANRSRENAVEVVQTWTQTFENITNVATIATLAVLDITIIVACAVSIHGMFTAFESPEKATTVYVKNRPPDLPRGTKVVETRATSDEDGVANIVYNNLYYACFEHEHDVLGWFNILCIHERYVLVPLHSYSDGGFRLDPVTGMASIKIYSKHHEQFVRHFFNPKFMYRVPNVDIVIIFVETINPVRSLLKYIPEEPLSDADLYKSMTLFFKHREEVPPISGGYVGTDKTVKVNTKRNRFHFNNLYCAKCVVPAGSSGGALLLDNTNQCRLVATQSSCGADFSHSSPLIRGDIQAGINAIKARLTFEPELPRCDSDVDEDATCEFIHVNYLGTTNDVVRISPKTSLKRTPLYGVIGCPEKTPVFHKYRGNDRIESMLNKTLLTELKPYEPRLLKETIDEYVQYWRSYFIDKIGVIPRGYTPPLDAIRGNYLGGKPLDLSTSPGIGVGRWIFNRQKSGHRDLMWHNPETGVIDAKKEFLDIVESEFLELSRGRTTTSTFAAFPKDELRNKAPRGIDGSPVEQKILYRMLFGRVDALLAHYNEGNHFYGPGINMQSTHGANLFKRIQGSHVCMWDFSKWDSTITWQLYEAAITFYNELLSDGLGRARLTLGYKTCMATIVCEEHVTQPCKGMRSGFGGTAPFNTHIHSLVLIMTLKKILSQNRIVNHPTFSDVTDYFDWIVYADDGLCWIKDPRYIDVLNGRTISEEFINQGWLVADPRGKTSLPPEFVEFHESVFLKYSPVLDRKISDQFSFPIWKIDYECIKNAISYYKGDDPYDALDNVFIFLLNYGEEEYERIRTIVNFELSHLRRTYAHSFSRMRDKMYGTPDSDGCYGSVVYDPDDWCDGII